MHSELRSKVRTAYSLVADKPEGRHPFPVGRTFAQSLGYSSELLSSLPAAAVESFAGVSNVSVFADIPTGTVVLDLGCGVGLDSIVAARRTGPGGQVIGVDFSRAMLSRARQGAAEARIVNTVYCQADAESLPLPDDSIDVALVNGIFNLNPARDAIFSELGRVVRPGGAVYAAELVLSQPLLAEQRTDSNWFA